MSKKLTLAVSSHFLVYCSASTSQVLKSRTVCTGCSFSVPNRNADITGLVQSTRGQLEVRNMRCRTEVWWSVRIFKLNDIIWKRKEEKLKKKVYNSLVSLISDVERQKVRKLWQIELS